MKKPCTSVSVQIVGDLAPNPRNPRLPFTTSQLQAFRKSLTEFGDLSGVVFNERTKQLVGGHKRTEQIRQDKDAKLNIAERLDSPDEAGTVAWGYIITCGTRFGCRIVDWSEEKEIAANLAANQFGADFDFQAVQSMLHDIDGKVDMDLTGFDTEDLVQILGGIEPAMDDSVEQGEKPPKKKGKPCPKCGHVP